MTFFNKNGYPLNVFDVGLDKSRKFFIAALGSHEININLFIISARRRATKALSSAKKYYLQYRIHLIILKDLKKI